MHKSQGSEYPIVILACFHQVRVFHSRSCSFSFLTLSSLTLLALSVFSLSPFFLSLFSVFPSSSMHFCVSLFSLFSLFFDFSTIILSVALQPNPLFFLFRVVLLFYIRILFFAVSSFIVCWFNANGSTVTLYRHD